VARNLSDDFELLDRYQSFSAEVLRLAVLGIGAIGFLIATAKDGGSLLDPAAINEGTKTGILLALGAFALSCALALGHRYFSTDSMACLKKLEGLREEAVPDQERITSEKAALRRAFRHSTRLIALCVLALGVGSMALALAFATALF
jgi:hypothetical protein